MPARMDRTGERRLMNCGEYATIIRYGNASDIDIKFDSGEIVYNRAYKRFINGSIIISRKKDRVGERRLMNCGEYAIIIRYGGCNDIDVKFDSGEVSYKRSYSSFIKGYIAKQTIMDRVGERRLMNCGEYATIINYKSCRSIDIKFDSGEIAYNRDYKSFIKGCIAKPLPNRVGERHLMNCGEYATIIRYGSYKDIDVKFDSGEIVKNKHYGCFLKGNIAKLIQGRIGERHLMNCGEYATIIRYDGYNDIDIQFDSGETVYKKNYGSFIRGNIAKPQSNRIGERRLMTCGLYASIIKYNNVKDIDVKFESGDIIKSYYYGSFKNGFCSPTWYSCRIMRKCYYDSVLNDVIILMKDGSIKRKSELLGGIE